MGHIPSLPGLCFRAQGPQHVKLDAPGRVAEYARWLIEEDLADINPLAAAVVERLRRGREADFRVAEAERRQGAAVWISGRPAVLFEADRRPLADGEVRAHLRFVSQVVGRMRMALAALTASQRARKPAPDRRSLDETVNHIGNCVWWYCSRIDDALPEPDEALEREPIRRVEGLLEDASRFLLTVPCATRSRVHVPGRFPSADPREPWTHTKVCRRQAEHVWEHLQSFEQAVRTAAST